MTLHNILRNTILTGIFTIPFLFIYVSSEMFFPFITGKNFGFRVIVEIISALYLILAWTNPSYRPKRTWMLVAYGVFIAVITLADFFGQNFYRSFWSNYERMEGLIGHLHLFAYFVVLVGVVQKERLWQWFFHVFLGVGVYVSLYGFLQLAREIGINQGSVRLDANFGNAIYFAVYMLYLLFLNVFLYSQENTPRLKMILTSFMVGAGLFVGYGLLRVVALPKEALFGTYHTLFFWGSFVFLCIGGYLFSILGSLREFTEKNLTRIFYGALFLANLVLLYYSASRGPVLGLIGGGILSAIIFSLISSGTGGARRYVIGGVIAIAVLIGLFITFRDAAFIRENQVLSRFASISLSERTTISRFTIWDMSWQGFKENPILGWGQDNFIYVFERFYKPSMWNQEPWFDRSHNVFFDWLIAGGTLGLLSYLALFAVALYYLFLGAGGRGFTVTEKSILIGLLAGFFFQNIFVFDNLTSYVMFFSVLAFVTCRATNSEEKNRVSDIKPIPLYLVPSVLVVLGLAMYFANVKPILASVTLIDTLQAPALKSKIGLFREVFSYNTFGSGEAREQLIQAAGQAAGGPPSPERSEIMELAKNEMKAHVAASNGDIRYTFFLGAYLAQIGENDEAIKYLEEARKVSPNKQPILFSLAGAHLAKNNFNEAFKVLKEVYDSDPSYPQAAAYYAVGAAYAAKDDVVFELLSKLTEPVPIPADQLMRAYVVRRDIPKAIELFRKLISSNQSNVQYRIMLSQVYLGLGDKISATREINEITKIHPELKEQAETYIRDIINKQ